MLRPTAAWLSVEAVWEMPVCQESRYRSQIGVLGTLARKFVRVVTGGVVQGAQVSELERVVRERRFSWTASGSRDLDHSRARFASMMICLQDQHTQLQDQHMQLQDQHMQLQDQHMLSLQEDLQNKSVLPRFR